MKLSAILILLPAVGLFGGCLSKSSHPKGTFAIASPLLANTTSTNELVIAVHRISVAKQFDNPSFTYRIGEFSYERDPYAVFLDSPGASFAEPVGAWLQNAGLFRAVVGPDSSLSANLGMETSIEQLYGDFRDRVHPLAVLEMRFLVFKKAGRNRGDVVFQKTYFRRIPLKARTAAATVAGWNEALQEIMKEFTADLTASDQWRNVH